MTKFIAHRGYSGIEKENTIPAFLLAGKCKYFYGIETDVHKTNDKEYIILHDDNLNRVSNGIYDLNVEKNPYSLIRNIKLPDAYSNVLRDDLYVPLMKDYFKICKQYNKIAICELKQNFTKDEIKEILEIVKLCDMENDTVFISFNFQNLKFAREINNFIPLQFLTDDFKEDYFDEYLKYNIGLDIFSLNLTRSTVDKFHDNGLLVNAWTVDDIEEAKRLIDIGVDFITSNILNSDCLRIKTCE